MLLNRTSSWQNDLALIVQQFRHPNTFTIGQVTYNSSLLLKNILQNTQTLQLFTMNIKTESIYKSY